MPLDEAAQRFAFLHQRDLRLLAERCAAFEARDEAIAFDADSGVATVRGLRGEVVPRRHGEVLATYAPRDRILRWSWAGRPLSSSATHADVVFREGQARGVPQLAMSIVGDLNPEDAATLVKLGALVVCAESVHERALGGDVAFVAIFDRPRPAEPVLTMENRISLPPPPRGSVPPGFSAAPDAGRARPSAGPAAGAYRSLPPIREVFEPRGGSRGPLSPSRPRPGSSPGVDDAFAPPAPPPPPPSSSPSATSAPKKLREPARALFLPVANAAVEALARASSGYLQGLFVVTNGVVTNGSEGRSGDASPTVVVHLVVLDAAGMLSAVDTPPDLREAAAAMVEADQREGNGKWRRLSARITPKPDGGATLHVNVL